MMRRLTKRAFLAGAIGFAGFGLLGFGGSVIVCNRKRLSALPLERLDIALVDIRAPERIGGAYRAQVGLAAVEAAFLGNPGLLAAIASDCPETRRGRIRTVIRADFVAGDVIVTDRWVVARSECLIAALRS